MSAPPPDRRRLPSAVFELEIERIRAGYYTDAYFNHTRELLAGAGRHPRVVVQVFQRHVSMLGGIDEAIAILREGAGRPDGRAWIPGWDELEVAALHEGDAIEPGETVMTITGDYTLFAHLETVYLGALARRSLVMRNVREAVAAAGGKPIVFFAARHDHWRMQAGDGWAARTAGATGVSTDAQGSWWGGRGVGTVPHGLIAAFGGDTVAAARSFADRFAAAMHITVLVDFDNDSVATALAVADALGDRLWGVRLDTSDQLADLALQRVQGPDAEKGVTPELVAVVREELDRRGHDRVRIVVSGGFDARRIRAFEAAAAPVDAYGVGSSLLDGRNDFTADVVVVDGRPTAKAGRRLAPNPRLEAVR